MPTYDYECKACQHRFEHFQSMSDKVLKKCPECGKNSLERLIGTGAALIFKGSGFYQTDYRSDSYKKAAESEKPTETKPAENPKADAKPEVATNESKSEKAAAAPAKVSPKPSRKNPRARKSK